MFDVDPCRFIAQVGEPDLDLRCALAVGGDVPEVAQPPRRLPDRDLAPDDLLACGRAFEDSAALATFENHLEALLLGHRGSLGPPHRGAGRPHVEGVVHRTLD
ncbi:MAG: hypothetical protein AUG06_04080 [Actinobacteria bacterium 13_1_20CM_2_65_11]|nr:MAG: hypothetical protein AUG06_04080 [Actinobacteria bacterium 13_1_20CM_2_65_11]